MWHGNLDPHPSSPREAPCKGKYDKGSWDANRIYDVEFGGGEWRVGIKMDESLSVFYLKRKSPLIAELRDF
jgi:hypothetical protein